MLLQLQFKRSVMTDAPDADGNGHDADEDEWHKDEDPVVPSRFEIVGGEQLEHQEKQVGGEADQHRLVLNVFLGVEAALRSAPPHVRPDYGTEN